MTFLSLIGIGSAVFILAITPGPGVFATVSRSLSSGFVPALFLVAGCVLGDILYLMFAVWGLAAVAQVFGELFVLVKIGGGIYLIWLGVRVWRSVPVSDKTMSAGRDIGFRASFFSGLVITLSNPKVIVFYCGFLPGFINLSALGPADVVMIAGAVAGVLFAVMAVYAFLASRARLFFTDARQLRRLNRTAGGLMIGTGVAIAVKS